jgi:hypothetical protein
LTLPFYLPGCPSAVCNSMEIPVPPSPAFLVCGQDIITISVHCPKMLTSYPALSGWPASFGNLTRSKDSHLYHTQAKSISLTKTSSY